MKVPKLEIHRVDNPVEYQALMANKKSELLDLMAEEESLTLLLNEQHGAVYTEAMCWPLKKTSRFLIDWQYSVPGKVNWRERLVCQNTRLNNRIRGAIHVFEQHCLPDHLDQIYLTEQHTVLFKWFRKNYPNACGSEYLDGANGFSRLKFKIRLFPTKLVHQDLTSLSYPEDAFDFALSFDCFEHIPEYQQALSELARVIKPKGRLLFSVPFDPSAANTLIRATMNADQTITHHTEPEYHGNPVSKQGSLSYYTFGWELLDQLKDVGFSDAYGLVYWSSSYAYLGGPQLLLCAEK